tara:strand:+ start:1715 stop:2647 length:933 start_codon:yes stop_codon:yes gene_type:complete
MGIIDDRFRKMLMMDYETKEGQNNQGFFGSNLTGGLLSNINPTLLIGADLIGSGVKGKDPFSSLVPALLKTAKIKQALTPKKGQSIKFNPTTGEFEISSGGAGTSVQQKNLNKAKSIKSSYDLLYKTIPSLQTAVANSKTGAVGSGVQLIDSIGDQIAQLSEINVPNKFKNDASEDIEAYIKSSGFAGEAQEVAKIKSSMTNLAYVLASIAEPGNPKYSEGDILRQFERIGFNSGSRKQIIAKLDQVLRDEYDRASSSYSALLPQSNFGYTLVDGKVTLSAPGSTNIGTTQTKTTKKKKKDKKNDPLGIR